MIRAISVALAAQNMSKADKPADKPTPAATESIQPRAQQPTVAQAAPAPGYVPPAPQYYGAPQGMVATPQPQFQPQSQYQQQPQFQPQPQFQTQPGYAQMPVQPVAQFQQVAQAPQVTPIYAIPQGYQAVAPGFASLPQGYATVPVVQQFPQQQSQLPQQPQQPQQPGGASASASGSKFQIIVQEVGPGEQQTSTRENTSHVAKTRRVERRDDPSPSYASTSPRDVKSARGQSFSAEDKLSILKLHLVDNISVSDLCDLYSIQPSDFFSWQRQLFQQGTSAFGIKHSSEVRQVSGARHRTDRLESQMESNNDRILELLDEQVRLRKQLETY